MGATVPRSSGGGAPPKRGRRVAGGRGQVDARRRAWDERFGEAAGGLQSRLFEGELARLGREMLLGMVAGRSRGLEVLILQM